MVRRSRALILGLLAAWLLACGPAAADAIDGNWCHPDGRRFTITGPDIVTPGGNRVSGDYSRHAYSYTVPASEPSPGQVIDMTLLSESTLQLRVGAAAGGTPEMWNRCGPSVSENRQERLSIG